MAITNNLTLFNEDQSGTMSLDSNKFLSGDVIKSEYFNQLFRETTLICKALINAIGEDYTPGGTINKDSDFDQTKNLIKNALAAFANTTIGVQQTYDASSSKAMSGVAVAQGIANAITTSINGSY